MWRTANGNLNGSELYDLLAQRMMHRDRALFYEALLRIHT
jgi:hypothetical protein